MPNCPVRSQRAATAKVIETFCLSMRECVDARQALPYTEILISYFKLYVFYMANSEHREFTSKSPNPASRSDLMTRSASSPWPPSWRRRWPGLLGQVVRFEQAAESEDARATGGMRDPAQSGGFTRSSQHLFHGRFTQGSARKSTRSTRATRHHQFLWLRNTACLA